MLEGDAKKLAQSTPFRKAVHPSEAGDTVVDKTLATPAAGGDFLVDDEVEMFSDAGHHFGVPGLGVRPGRINSSGAIHRSTHHQGLVEHRVRPKLPWLFQVGFAREHGMDARAANVGAPDAAPYLVVPVPS